MDVELTRPGKHSLILHSPVMPAAGTFGYAPPEQFVGRASPASDLYGLAMSYLAVATGQEVPLVYLAWAAGYCLVYSSMAMVLALLLFEDRDLA